MLRLHALITIPALIISGHADSIPLKMPLNDYYKLHSIIIGSWLKSYLHNRSQSVRVGSVSSNSFTVTTGVPQGSVLGRVLFSVYISPSNYLIATHNLQHQQYADDTQLYIAVSPHRFCVFSHQARILSHRSLLLAFTQRPLSESYEIGCCSVWYSAKAPCISTHYIRQYRGLCCTSV